MLHKFEEKIDTDYSITGKIFGVKRQNQPPV